VSENGPSNIDPPFMIERVARMKVMLQEIEKEIVAGNPPPDVLSDFKGAVDDVRTSLWAVMTSDGSGGYRSVLAQLRSSRITDMLERIMLDLETGSFPRSTQSYRVFRDQVIAAAERLQSLD